MYDVEHCGIELYLVECMCGGVSFWNRPYPPLFVSRCLDSRRFFANHVVFPDRHLSPVSFYDVISLAARAEWAKSSADTNSKKSRSDAKRSYEVYKTEKSTNEITLPDIPYVLLEDMAEIPTLPMPSTLLTGRQEGAFRQDRPLPGAGEWGGVIVWGKTPVPPVIGSRSF